MSKLERHAAIRDLVGARPVRTQGELTDALRERGFKVTQATVSRDIKEIPLQKMRTLNGIVYDWRGPIGGAGDRLAKTMRDSVVSVAHSVDLVLLKTGPGMAAAVAVVLDETPLEDKLGTVAGDDTVLIVTKDSPGCKKLHKLLKGMLGE